MHEGAGKTHTMEGSKQDPGINYRAMKELFRCLLSKIFSYPDSTTTPRLMPDS